MGSQIGLGYLGSDAIKTSTSNQDIIPKKENGYAYTFKKFAFYNKQQATVKINGGDPIVLLANQGFTCDITDPPIHSFIIVNSGVEHNWIGMY